VDFAPKFPESKNRTQTNYFMLISDPLEKFQKNANEKVISKAS